MISSELFTRRTALIILHPLLITFILLSSYPIIYEIPTPFWFIILTSFIIAAIFFVLQNWFNKKVMMYLIFFSDILIIGAMIHYSGGLQSMFPFFYVLLIILSSLYLYRKGAYIISLSTVIFFLVLVFLEARDSTQATQMIMYRFYIFSLLFMFTGILSGALSERYQKGAEEAERLRLTTAEIVNNLPSGIITIDNNGDIIYTNIPVGVIRSSVHLHLAKFLKNPNIQSSNELKIGNRYYVLSCARIHNSRGGLGILQDYTEIRKLEEQSRVSRQTKLLAELGGSLAHEIRNPLSSIRGSLEVIREAEKNKNTLHFINMALKESIRLNEIVTDFLNYAQFVPLKMNRLHVREVINEAIADTLQIIEDRNIKIKRKDSDFVVLGDLNKLKSCFVNILNNAYEVTQEGGVIEVESYATDKNNIIEIRDHGKGIPSGLLNRIFDPFYTTKKGGTGLGLAITKKIIESHGGEINVESTVDDGTTFRIELPPAGRE